MTVDDDLIAKYLSGEATPEEAMALHDWLDIPGNRSRFDEMEATWNEANPSKAFKAVDKQMAWRKLRPAKNFAWPIGIAATVLLLIGFWTFNSNDEVEIVRITASERVDTVKLPDESVVTLNRHSQLHYPVKFKGDTREIDLERGEAFFSITKNADKPFIVHASFSSITVVGTEFNVLVKDDVVEVGVNEGVVLVVTAYDSIYIRKGLKAAFHKQEKAMATQNDPNKWAYATGRLVFRDTPMNQVIEAIEKTYSCQVSVSNDAIKKCTLNTTFEKDSVGKILLLISETLNLKLEQNGQVFILEGDGCP